MSTTRDIDPIAPLDFRGLRALVMGAAGGIGSRIADDLSRAGATVYACDRAGSNWPDPRRQTFALDLTVGDAVRATLDRSMPSGAVDILVNCAGTRDVQPLVDVSLADWSRAIDVNLTGTFLVSQWAAARAAEAGQPMTIVNLASTAGLAGMPDRAAYVAAKHGVVGLTKQMAIELAPSGTRVNAVAPGVVRTDMTERYFDDPATVSALERSHPLGLIGRAEDISAAVLFLASDRARYVTGAVLSVDGGFAAGKAIT